MDLAAALSPTDVKRLARATGLSTASFHEQYLSAGEVKGEFQFRILPCPFLRDNRCKVYADRPADCRSLPHLHKREFTTRLIRVVGNCEI
jgi:Fe-S-cluster containining protein